MSVLSPSSVTWRYLGDVRFPLVLGRAFLLQTMHPTIAAGIAEHSTFKTDPWGRLHRSWQPVLRTLYEPDGHLIGERIRARHRNIRGTTEDGRRYHALEPQAYWWVLATGLDSMFTFGSRFGRPLTTAEQHLAVDEVRELGRRLGLRDRDMPRDLAEFRSSFNEVVDGVLGDNQTVHDFLEVLQDPPAPSRCPTWLWGGTRTVIGAAGWLVAVGTLPVRAHDVIGVTWTVHREIGLRAISAASRALEALPANRRTVPVARSAMQRRLAPSQPRSTS